MCCKCNLQWFQTYYVQKSFAHSGSSCCFGSTKAYRQSKHACAQNKNEQGDLCHRSSVQQLWSCLGPVESRSQHCSVFEAMISSIGTVYWRKSTYSFAKPFTQLAHFLTLPYISLQEPVMSCLGRCLMFVPA